MLIFQVTHVLTILFMCIQFYSYIKSCIHKFLYNVKYIANVVGFGNNLHWMEIWSNRSSYRLAKVVCWPCCVLHLCLCSCFCVVMGAIGMVSAKWHFPTRDSIGCTEYHCFCDEHALHIHCGPIIPYHALSLEVWLVHLLCLFRGTHDPLSISSCPETKNIPIEEMTLVWKKHWFWRRFMPEDRPQVETLC